MSDYGDFCRDMREHKKALRMHWHECPHCAVRFGTGTKVPPGGKCRHDGWIAPGKPGDDKRAVNRKPKHDPIWEDIQKAEKEKKSKKQKILRTCRVCGKELRSGGARKDHERDKHPEAEKQPFKEILPDGDNYDFDIGF